MLPKGTRDILPGPMRVRTHIMRIVESVFQRYAFVRIETPAIELNSSLTGKYGEEGDQLMFKVLPRGEKLKKFEGKTASEMQAGVEEALRYDLTVPFARFVVDHRNDLAFPFKRYQIQNVWRGDRPQKGRYREFTQCDADVVGISGIVQEAEMMHIYNDVFRSLDLPAKLALNHRKLLLAIAEKVGAADRFIPFTVALDKLDKIGWAGVRSEWESMGIVVDDQWASLFTSELHLDKDGLTQLAQWLGPAADQALEELTSLSELLSARPLDHLQLQLDLTLARGLDYYTGCIFEIRSTEAKIGSLGGGGRYDDLTSVFGLKDTPGIGISFGLDRIQLAMEELGLTEAVEGSKTQLLIAHMGASTQADHFAMAQQLREEGWVAELYPTAARLKKQMAFASRSGIRFFILRGEQERDADKVLIKDLQEGVQTEATGSEWIDRLREMLPPAGAQ